jgi:Leucine-rich repeat (LRR) protein
MAKTTLYLQHWTNEEIPFDLSLLKPFSDVRALFLEGIEMDTRDPVMDAVSGFTQLKKLTVVDAGLVSMKGISRAPVGLERLDVHDNDITTVSDQHPSLRVLDLSNNPIVSIDGIVAFPRLSQVDFKLSVFPAGFNWRSLGALKLEGGDRVKFNVWGSRGVDEETKQAFKQNDLKVMLVEWVND